jgi:hypothetical protein
MIEPILHFLGFCPDHFNHINMIDAPWQEILNVFNQFKSIFRK